MDDQELDLRASTGTIYWEGAVRARGRQAAGIGLSGTHRILEAAADVMNWKGWK